MTPEEVYKHVRNFLGKRKFVKIFDNKDATGYVDRDIYDLISSCCERDENILKKFFEKLLYSYASTNYIALQVNGKEVKEVIAFLQPPMILRMRKGEKYTIEMAMSPVLLPYAFYLLVTEDDSVYSLVLGNGAYNSIMLGADVAMGYIVCTNVEQLARTFETVFKELLKKMPEEKDNYESYDFT